MPCCPPAPVWLRDTSVFRADASPIVRNCPAEGGRPDSPVDAGCEPERWHLAHTTWFFESSACWSSCVRLSAFRPALCVPVQLLLRERGSASPTPVGALDRPPRVRRPRMSVATGRMSTMRWMICSPASRGSHASDRAFILDLGINHEQQHQELMLTDILHAFSCNPLCSSL